MLVLVWLCAWGTGGVAAATPAGVLRVCTTGDYPPFSLRGPDGRYRGVDIALAGELAAALHVTPRWVPTTWRTLTTDFPARCDIAVGGISDTPARRRVADFSVPLVVDGKVPIVRRGDADKYATLAGIDRPQVRVIVNPGGGNEAFARAHFPHAHLIVWPDNLTVCDRLADGTADVFVTDSVEGRYRQRGYPGLVVLHPDRPFDTEAKAFMLPAGRPLFAAFVDGWLRGEIRGGRVAVLMNSWL